MSDFDIYVFILCFIVFVLLTLVFTFMIAEMMRMQLKMIRCGLVDKEIKKEHRKSLYKGCVSTIAGKAFSLLLCLALCVAFGFSVYINSTEEKAPNGIPSLKVAKSASMAKKHEANTYLVENGLDDQIQTFDIIVTRPLPPEDELDLFDIVVYKQDELLVTHRIVSIEEPNEEHPDERHFLLQGDAVDRPDRFPVLYSQMQGIYAGERIPFAGSFVLFLQSPAGWLCILLVLVAMIATPLVEKKLVRETKARLKAIKEEEQKRQLASELELERQITELAGV